MGPSRPLERRSRRKSPGTTKRPEEPFDRTASPRVPAALTSASKGSENSSLSGGPRSGRLPDLPPSPLHPDFRGLRPALQLKNRCGSESFHTDRWHRFHQNRWLGVDLAGPSGQDRIYAWRPRGGRGLSTTFGRGGGCSGTCPLAANTGSRRSWTPAIV